MIHAPEQPLEAHAADRSVGWSQTLESLLEEWQAVRSVAPPEFVLPEAERCFAEMCRERADLLDAGRWRAGPWTALQVLGLQHDERTLSRCLAWLLRPDGHHAAGDRLLRRTAALAGLALDGGPAAAVVRVEERRMTSAPRSLEPRTTIADIVVYAEDFTLVVESKVLPAEQPGQLRRLRSTWRRDRQPAFLLVTRTEHEQRSHGEGERWPAVTWQQLGRALAQELPPQAAAEARVIISSFSEV